MFNDTLLPVQWTRVLCWWDRVQRAVCLVQSDVALGNSGHRNRQLNGANKVTSLTLTRTSRWGK